MMQNESQSSSLSSESPPSPPSPLSPPSPPSPPSGLEGSDLSVEMLPQAHVSYQKDRISTIWIIPIIALIIGATLAYQAFMSRGPSVIVVFSAAEGLEAKKTKVKYKDVIIGRVKSVVLTEDLSQVKVKLQISKKAEGLISSQTRFWIVRPRVRGMSISGLETLLSGTYVALDPGRDASERREQYEFIGLDTPPIITHEEGGELFTLTAETLGSLDYNSPVYYRDITVGRVVAYNLTPNGQSVEVKVFVDQPYNTYVNRDTRFWSAFGIDVEVNAQGVRFNSKSLASLMVGGVSFMNPSDTSVTNRDDQRDQAESTSKMRDRSLTFHMHNDRKSALQKEFMQTQKYVLKFNETLRGLAIGDPVEFKGFPVGRVSSISIDTRERGRGVLTLVKITIESKRFQDVTSDHELSGPQPSVSSLISAFVERGLRAQVLSNNFLTGRRFVMLDFFERAPKASVRVIDTNLIEIPTYPAPINEITDGVTQLLARVQKIPFDQVAWETVQLLRELRSISARVNTITQSDEVSDIIEHTKVGLLNFSSLLARDSRVMVLLQRTLRELRSTAKSLRNLTDQIERHPEWLLRGK